MTRDLVRGTMRSLSCISLLVLLLVAVGECALHGPTRNRDLSQQQPTVVEVDLRKESLSSVLDTARSEQLGSSRQRRQTQPTVTPPGFGTTVVLENDTHNFALVHWSGQPKQRIFILTRLPNSDGYSEESFLYISYDYGKSFKNVTNKFPSDAVLDWYWISSNADILIFSDRENYKLYVTMDEGDNFYGYDLPFTHQDRYGFRFQYSRVPNVEKYERYVLGYDKSTQSLWVTSNVNSSTSWHQLGSGVSRYAWRELNSTFEDPTTVYFDNKTNNTAAQLYYATWNGTNWTRNCLFSPSPGFFSPGTFVLSYQYMFVQRNYTDLGLDKPTEYQSPLWVSTYRNGFNQARFPLEFEEKHYATVDASEDQVFIAVYHNGSVTNMYISEEAGLNYSLSLENIVSPGESDWEDGYPTFDVYVVEALVGTYIANRISESGNGYTVISFDKGGEWRPLTPPTVNRNGVPIICNLPCSLHLHMYIDEDNGFQPILSQESAPGIIMALGNTGTSLSNSVYRLRLYMSINGGVSWLEVSTGFEEFQLLDFGVFMAYTDKWTGTNTVWWSCTEGAEWTVFHYVDYLIYVVRMFTERGEKAQHATVFGYLTTVSSQSEFEWLVIDLDFSTLNLTECNSSDYYQWQPTDERSDQQCILGENFIYERRLPDHCCYINSSYERPVDRSLCFCAAEDFECDFGFERIDLDGPCVPQSGFAYPPFAPPNCPEGETYSYTSGYRKISGDKCVKGNDTTFDPIIKECPVEAPGGLSISTDNDYYHVGGTVHFMLNQTQGAFNVTTYTWDFGDGISVPINGFENAMFITHNYGAPPQIYTVTVTATDVGGQGFAQKDVTVIDTMTNLSLSSTAAFINTPYILNVNISTKYGTLLLGDLCYEWSVNGTTLQKGFGLKTFYNTFTTVGNATVGVTVSNSLDILSQNVIIPVINVPSMSLSVSLIGSEPAPSSDYVPANAQVYLIVQSSVGQFPSDTVFKWTVTSFDGSTLIMSKNTKATSISMKFPYVGKFLVSVKGTAHSVSFSLNHVITAVDNITSLKIPFTYAFLNNPMDLYVNYTTQNGSQILEPLVYHWMVNGSQIYSGSSSSVRYTFKKKGNAMVNVTVSTSLQSLSQVAIIPVSDIPNLLLGISVNGQPLPSNSFAPQATNVTLVAIPSQGELPADTSFQWTVSTFIGDVLSNDTSTVYFLKTTSDNFIEYSFNFIGEYMVQALGTATSVTFSFTQYVFVEEVLSSINVSGLLPGYRINTNVTLTIILPPVNYNGYSRNLQLKVLLDDSPPIQLLSQQLTFNRDQASVSFPFTSSGTFSLTVLCLNDVSNVSFTQPTFAADSSEYQYLRLIFNTTVLPSEYSSYAWQLALQDSITTELSRDLELEEWQLMVNVTEEQDTSTVVAVERRRSSSPEMVVVAHVYILPDSLSAQDVDAVEKIAAQLIDNANNGNLSFTVNNKTVAVTSADTGPVIVIDDSITTSYLPLVIGLSIGGFLIVLVLLVVVIVAIIYWKKKYRKLEVRYTRLRQGPMRFTFTAEGETLEEEDYPDSDEDGDDEKEGKEDMYQMTDKTQLTED